jgi:tRNA pseudouridine38-40 synthase
VQPIRDPLRERFAWRVWPDITGDLLNQAAAQFIGAHDFSTFGSATTPKRTTVRSVTTSAWKMLNGEWQFEVQADAFLYRMVRHMVYAQVAVAQSRCSLEDVHNAIHRQSPLPSGLAPACGLTLVEVTYGLMV